MIPYFEQPSIPLFGDFKIHAFGVLVAIGIILGSRVTIGRAAKLGLDTAVLSDLIVWTVGTGFVVGHVFEIVFYESEKIATDPLVLVKLWQGLSSTGGFLGAAIGCGLFCWRRKISFLEYGDTIAYGLPLGWFFGRLGCTVAHDHPGRHATSMLWFAVNYPGGPRYDLGMTEMLFTLVLMTSVFVSGIPPRQADGKRAPVLVRHHGFYLGLICVAYAPVRFAMDFLRAGPGENGDIRYGGLTPAQWGMFLLLATGVWILREGRARAARGIAYHPPEPGSETDGEGGAGGSPAGDGGDDARRGASKPKGQRKSKASRKGSSS